MISREVRGLERALDALSARFTAEAGNIANINTPHYARQDVNFEDALSSALDSEGGGNPPEAQDPVEALVGPSQNTNDMLEMFQPTVTTDKQSAMRLDGNGTSLEYEMSQVVKTAQKYNTVASQIATQYRTFKFITDQK